MDPSASTDFGPACSRTNFVRPLFVGLGLIVILFACLAGASPAAAAPVNDYFADAQTLNGLPVTATGSNEAATREPGEPDHNGVGNDHSVWFNWTAPSSGTVAIDLGGSGFWTWVAVYTGSAVGSLTLVGKESDGGSTFGTSRLEFAATAGVTYRIAVDGWQGETGTIKLEVFPPGSISGTLWKDNFAGTLAETCVDVYDSAGELVASTETNNAGTYRVDKLATGDYRLMFGRCSFNNVAIEFYEDETSLATADPVSVTAGTPTPDVDAQLAPGGSVSGTITDDLGVGVGEMCIDVFDSNGEMLKEDRSNSFGVYFLTSLATGSYRLRFHDCGTRLFVTEFYEDKTSLVTADEVEVSSGENTFNVDARQARDTIAPDTIIDSGSAGTITVAGATFTFSGIPADDTSKVQCRMDQAAYADCTSPKSFSGLTEGLHTVSFRAEDFAGNRDESPATRTFTVDAIPPDPIIGPGPIVPVPVARIGKVSVKGPAKVRRGKKATYRVKITNAGTAAATGVKLQVRGRGVASRTSAGTIRAGQSKILKIKLKPKKAGSIKVAFKMTSKNAGGKTVRRRISVKQ